MNRALAWANRIAVSQQSRALSESQATQRNSCTGLAPAHKGLRHKPNSVGALK